MTDHEVPPAENAASPFAPTPENWSAIHSLYMDLVYQFSRADGAKGVVAHDAVNKAAAEVAAVMEPPMEPAAFKSYIMANLAALRWKRASSHAPKPVKPQAVNETPPAAEPVEPPAAAFTEARRWMASISGRTRANGSAHPEMAQAKFIMNGMRRGEGRFLVCATVDVAKAVQSRLHSAAEILTWDKGEYESSVVDAPAFEGEEPRVLLWVMRKNA